MATVNPKYLLKIFFVIVALLVSANESHAQIAGKFISEYYQDAELIFKKNGRFVYKGSEQQRLSPIRFAGRYTLRHDTISLFQHVRKNKSITHTECFNPALKDTISIEVASSYGFLSGGVYINGKGYNYNWYNNGKRGIKVVLDEPVQYLYLVFYRHNSPVVKIKNVRSNEIKISLLDPSVEMDRITYGENYLFKGDTLVSLEKSEGPINLSPIRGDYINSRDGIHHWDLSADTSSQNLISSIGCVTFDSGIFKLAGCPLGRFETVIHLDHYKLRKRTLSFSGSLAWVQYPYALKEEDVINGLEPVEGLVKDYTHYKAYLCSKVGERYFINREIKLNEFRKYNLRDSYIVVEVDDDFKLVYNVGWAEKHVNLYIVPPSK